MVGSHMRTRLIVTMRNAFARRYVAHHSLLKPEILLDGLLSARLIGAPGYCMRISVEQSEEVALRSRLDRDFVIQRDYIPHPAALAEIASY